MVKPSTCIKIIKKIKAKEDQFWEEDTIPGGMNSAIEQNFKKHGRFLSKNSEI